MPQEWYHAIQWAIGHFNTCWRSWWSILMKIVLQRQMERWTRGQWDPQTECIKLSKPKNSNGYMVFQFGERVTCSSIVKIFNILEENGCEPFDVDIKVTNIFSMKKERRVYSVSTCGDWD